MLAQLDQQIIGSLVTQPEINEKLDELAELVENQVLVALVLVFLLLVHLTLLLALLGVGLEHAFKRLESLREEAAPSTRGTCIPIGRGVIKILAVVLLLLMLFSLLPFGCVLNLDCDYFNNTFTPVMSISMPNAMII